MCGFNTGGENKEQIVSKQTYPKRSGVAYIWAAIFLIIFILLAGLGFDAARAFVAAHQLQNAADAAVLAGARIVRVSQPDARQKAMDIAYENFVIGARVHLDENADNADPDNGDIVTGIYNPSDKTFTPDTNNPNALKVIAKRTGDSLNGSLPLIFGPVAGVNNVDISRTAIALALGGWGAGIIALDCYAEDALTVPDAATDVTITGGGIQVNSENGEAFTPHQRVEFEPLPEVINVVGGIDDRHFPDGLYDITTTGAPRMPDPLCPDAQCDGSVAGGDCLPEPDFGTPIQTETVDLGPNETRTIQPGYYPGGIRLLSSNETLLLEPGIYILDGEGLYINGGNLIGDGVMFYITGTGKIDLQGNGIVQINQNFEIESGPYAGIAIYQDRDNNNPAIIQGTNNLDITGTIYFPRNHVKITGTGDGFGTQLIANTIEIGGHGLIQINYDGRNPFPANKAVLVY